MGADTLPRHVQMVAGRALGDTEFLGDLPLRELPPREERELKRAGRQVMSGTGRSVTASPGVLT